MPIGFFFKKSTGDLMDFKQKGQKNIHRDGLPWRGEWDRAYTTLTDGLALRKAYWRKGIDKACDKARDKE
jgi:hypothetical protein